jgi:hypothetical protein
MDGVPCTHALAGDALDRHARITQLRHGPFELHRAGGRALDDGLADLLRFTARSAAMSTFTTRDMNLPSRGIG